MLTLSWEDLEDRSNRLASFLKNELEEKTPVIVFGHKDPMMIVGFLACAKVGRPYVPIDESFPSNRINDIVRSINPELIFNFSENPEIFLQPEYKEFHSISKNEATKIILELEPLIEESLWPSPEQIFYIIFTSGSTGKPKGVQISSGALDSFISWAVTLCVGSDPNNSSHLNFINQAPFSFDLSIFDLGMSLFSGGTLWALTKECQNDYSDLISFLKNANPDVWVSTPSFAEYTMGEPAFSNDTLGNLRNFIFCGETLTHNTASRLAERFPSASIYNTYGPTESTVAVTGVMIDENILKQYESLPVGVPKPGTYIKIVGEEGESLSQGDIGEILIAGDTVSIGYWENPEETKKKFCEIEIDDSMIPAYKTGDLGYFNDGMLFFSGRKDFQIKLHGYRIELEDIENNIMQSEMVHAAVVLPDAKDGIIDSLTAYVVLQENNNSQLKNRSLLRKDLKLRIPEYMIPKNFVFIDEMPFNINGKIDRKQLEKMQNV